MLSMDSGYGGELVSTTEERRGNLVVCLGDMVLTNVAASQT